MSEVFNPCSPGKIEKTIFEIILFYLFTKNNSATKGFISSSKLSSELYLAEGPQLSRKERFIPSQVLTVWSTW